MKKKTSKKTPVHRTRAEGMLAKQKEQLRELSAKDLKNLVQDLETHQIELEMQNEELRRTRQELETSHNKFVELYDFSPVGYFTVDARGLITEDEPEKCPGVLCPAPECGRLKRRCQMS